MCYLSLCGLVMSNVLLVWWCCHRFFSVLSVHPSQFHFHFLAGPAIASGQFFHNYFYLLLIRSVFTYIVCNHLLMRTNCSMPIVLCVTVLDSDAQTKSTHYPFLRPVFSSWAVNTGIVCIGLKTSFILEFGVEYLLLPFRRSSISIV